MLHALRVAREHPAVPVVVLCLGGLTAALTQTLVIPIQSELPALLGTSPANASWVVTVTLLCAAVTMPVAGRVADTAGKQRVLAASAGILLVGSLVCALSSSLDQNSYPMSEIQREQMPPVTGPSMIFCA